MEGRKLYGQDAQHHGVPTAFHDNEDGTITDMSTGLMWQKTDNGKGLNWEQALACAEGLSLVGHSDWRPPNAEELQSIVD